MFARGNWAVFGFQPSSLKDFTGVLNSPTALVRCSQVANAAITRVLEFDTYGINPYGAPRLDEARSKRNEDQETVNLLMHSLVSFLKDGTGPEDAGYTLVGIPEAEDIPALDLFGSSIETYTISEGLYGFWFVLNRWKDISHVASRKEALAYERAERPYKFLDRDTKKDVDDQVATDSNLERKQFAVIVDTFTHRVYAETTSKAELLALQSLFSRMGLLPTMVAWQFGEGSDWAADFLHKVYQESFHKSAFLKRAEDVKTFNNEEREALEDREMEKLVSTFFATTQMDSDQWASLKASAGVRLYPASSPIVVGSPTNATILLTGTEGSQVVAASVVFQERISYVRKEVETSFRKDIYTLDVNDAMNNADVGVALLRGLDFPDFVKAINKEIRKTKTVPSLPDFWRRWRDAIDASIRDFTSSVTFMLELDRSLPAGIVTFGASEISDAVIEEPAVTRDSTDHVIALT